MVSGSGSLARSDHRVDGSPHADAHAVLLDRDLAHSGLLDDADDLADALGTCAIDASRRQRLVAARALANRVQERLCLLAEQRQQQQLLLARRDTVHLLAQRVEVDRLGLDRLVVQLRRTDERRIDRAWRAPEPAEHEVAKLVDRGRVAVGAEHVEQGLRRDDLADRRRERRRTDLATNAIDFDEHLVQPIAGGLAAQLHLEGSDEADRQLVLRRAHRDARSERRNRLVPDVLVDEIGGLPQPCKIDAGVEPEARERLRRRLGGHAVQRQRHGVDRGPDQVGAGTGRLERRRQRVAARALRVEAHRQARDGAKLGGQLARPMRLQQRRGIVQENPGGAELRQALRRRDECFVPAASVQQSRVELAPRVDDRLGGLAEVVDVVQRIVEPEDVDAALGRTGDEAPCEVAPDRARADEEAAAQRQRERRLDPCLERPDPRPRALDPAVDGAVEDAAAGNLEVGEPGGVEHLGEAQDVGGRDQARQRLLAQDADRRVDQTRHRGHLTAARSYRPATQAGPGQGRNNWSDVCGSDHLGRVRGVGARADVDP